MRVLSADSTVSVSQSPGDSINYAFDENGRVSPDQPIFGKSHEGYRSNRRQHLPPSDTIATDTSPEISDLFVHKDVSKSSLTRIWHETKIFTISFLLIMMRVISDISLPIYTGNMARVGGDPYVAMVNNAMWFPVVIFSVSAFMKLVYDRSISLRPPSCWKEMSIIGLSLTVGGIFILFSSLPDRTPPYLQAILGCVLIPFTVVMRRVVLKKGISKRRLVCTFIIVIGLFECSVPQIWNMEGGSRNNYTSDTKSLQERILWAVAFCLAFLPFSLNAVIGEKSMKQEKSQVLSFLTWVHIIHVLRMWPAFWTDLIPRFGMATSVDDFKTRLHDGFSCADSTSPTCQGIPLKSWVVILSHCFALIFQFPLIQHSEGAIYSVVVQTVKTPVAAVFWTLFRYDFPNDKFYWEPVFNKTTAFIIAGLLILVPSVFTYNYFSVKDAQRDDQQNDDKKEDTLKELNHILSDMNTEHDRVTFSANCEEHDASVA